jgi:hypothetical protein
MKAVPSPKSCDITLAAHRLTLAKLHIIAYRIITTSHQLLVDTAIMSVQFSTSMLQSALVVNIIVLVLVGLMAVRWAWSTLLVFGTVNYSCDVTDILHAAPRRASSSCPQTLLPSSLTPS